MYTKEKLMLADLIVAGYKNYKGLDYKNVDEYIELNSKLILEDYIEADNKHIHLLNKNSVIEYILLENYSKDFFVSEVEGILHSSQSLFHIANEVKDEKISSVKQNLTPNGNWILYKESGTFHLSKKWNKKRSWVSQRPALCFASLKAY